MATYLFRLINQLVRIFQPIIESDQVIYRPLDRGVPGTFYRQYAPAHLLVPLRISNAPVHLMEKGRAYMK
ncbi:hypothetical protein [Nibrella viscosa]|uniref:hypothetical protein n=1 Tax=Nibrella viscosa TaxID=1084524 RepID=UPI0031E66C23